MSPRMLEELKSFFTTLIGKTSDTDGSATAGTLTAKANAILSGQEKQAQQETVQDILSKLNASGAITVNAVKSVQRGIIVIPANGSKAQATINEVDMSKAVVFYGGSSSNLNNSGSAATALHYLYLHNSTTVVAQQSISWNGEKTVAYQVIEFY